jgi:hypothetical protein
VQVSPNRTITIGGKEYVLDASFATLRAVQEHFKLDLVFIFSNILNMRVDQTTDLIAIASGQDANAIGQAILDTMDVMDFRASAPYYLLKIELIAWLSVAVAPQDAKEKKRAEMDAIIAKQKSLPSLGQSTSSSV